jgi:hypothetical protein
MTCRKLALIPMARTAPALRRTHRHGRHMAQCAYRLAFQAHKARGAHQALGYRRRCVGQTGLGSHAELAFPKTHATTTA